jgi:hypothetical protein
MPFTISHTAAVLPFARWLRRGQLLSAAVIGSMVPDSLVFIPDTMSRHDTHGLVALFTFCLPVGLLWYWVFQLHIKPATYELMPDRLFIAWGTDARSASLKSAKQWLLASLGVLLGAFTHAAWDGFTHENARGVRMLTAFDGMGLTVGAHSLAWFRILQHVSSILGLLFVIGFVWRDVRRAHYSGPALTRRFSPHERHRWFAMYVAAAVVISIIAFLLLMQGRLRLTLALNYAAIGSLWGLAGSLLSISLLINWLKPRPPPKVIAGDRSASASEDCEARQGSPRTL